MMPVTSSEQSIRDLCQIGVDYHGAVTFHFNGASCVVEENRQEELQGRDARLAIQDYLLRSDFRSLTVMPSKKRPGRYVIKVCLQRKGGLA